MTSYFQNGTPLEFGLNPDQVRHESGKWMGNAKIGDQINSNGDQLTAKSVDKDAHTGMWHSHVEITAPSGAKRIHQGEHASEEEANTKVNDVLQRNMQ